MRFGIAQWGQLEWAVGEWASTGTAAASGPTPPIVWLIVVTP